MLAEKPDQASHYAEAFSSNTRKKGYIEVEDKRFFQGKAFITWGFGHLVELQEPEKYKPEWGRWALDALPIMPETFKFQVSDSKKNQFNIVKGLLKDATEIIVGTDSDREGENIARSIITLVGAAKKPTKRLWINSLETNEIIQGFHNLKEGNDYLPLYHEAQTRQIADWVVGINTSRLYSLLLQKKGIREVFSVGRVQTPTLFLIYQRQQEIEHFQPVPFYELFADVQAQNGAFTAKYSDKFDSNEQAQELLRNHWIEKENSGRICKVDKQLKKQKSPKLHSLSSLQEKANRLWKYSPADVLKTVQVLYEKKLLSYPRTDCHFITNAEFQYLAANIEHYQALLGFEVAYPEARKGYIEPSKVQEHYALIPTKRMPTKQDINALETKEKNIYLEVLSNTAAMFASDYEYEETKIEIDIKGLLFKKTGKVEKKKGWKALFQEPSDEEEKEKTSTLPLVNEGERIQSTISVKEGITTPPKSFTEGELIKVMKTAGYKGTQAIKDEEEKAILKETEGIGTEATRAEMIETLKKKQYIEVKKNQVSITEKGIILCESVKGTLLSSPEMTAKWEIYLKKIGQREGDPTKFLSNIQKFITHLLEEAPKQLASELITDRVEKAITVNAVGTCPCCQKSIIDKGKFYGCEGYSDGCRFSLPKLYLNKTISETNIKKLLKNKKTGVIKGFKSKKDKVFEAMLILNDANELKMEFPQNKQ
ncbi:DNA topoisomerase III [Domibacillus aminovorans]|uniref:DNA topoisomerase n=1 Tax=Domibacillus aminovorans TaxID=29332 RepID=A0A177KZB1_9BACI|nr:type IA DNA topoisomerase [Domibacillus aminovorans]OAH58683.1 DNA topoisomerase III [Domibacillus aminovorans]